MKNIYLFAFLVGVVFNSSAQGIQIIPQPAEMKQPKIMASFNITPATQIVLEGSGLENSANFLNDYLQRFYNYKLKIAKKSSSANVIVLNYEKMEYAIAGAYTLTTNNKGVYIAGDNETGVFYGVQTLLQLLPVRNPLLKNILPRLAIPYVSIKDYPRFSYRGLMLDAGRHFFPVDFVKTYIDYIALHKMNYFHWHLTEDQGWRIEIKKYPKLTSIGGYRNGTIIGRYPGKGNDDEHYGGFYTQEEIKDVVKYAAARYITVIPELELPGHGSAAIAAYPQLSCFPDSATVIPPAMISPTSKKQLADGRIKLVQETWGVFEDVFAPTDYTFNFLQDVIDEILPLFPAKYIHIGGDECPKEAWKKSAFCQQLIKEKGLKDEHGLQSYFIGRIEKYINSKGKQIIGWDEILEGGLAPNATVMSWRGEEGGIDAAKQNHDVIMTPGAYVYLDHAQTKKEDSVTIGGYLPLENVYKYEPIPAALNEAQAKHILGAQGNVWTEYMGNNKKVEYMIFPRLSALSEVLWSPKEKKNYSDFEKRLQTQFKRYDLWQANYSKAYYELHSAVLPASDHQGVYWSLTTKAPGKINYYINNSAQTRQVPDVKKDPAGRSMQDTIVVNQAKIQVYDKPVLVQESAVCGASIEKLPASAIRQTFTVNKATGKAITLAAAPAVNWPGTGAGAFGLVNGVLAENGLSSAEWLGWQAKDMEAVIDLGTAQSFSTIYCHLMEQKASWIYLPVSIETFTSSDGSIFTSVGKTSEYTATEMGMRNATLNITPATARYVKIVAKNFGKIPDGQPGAGNTAWLFVDEIQVD
ncbi:MAG: beta-N-acetylhexosaminidase [Chitinophagaceae bacterium]